MRLKAKLERANITKALLPSEKHPQRDLEMAIKAPLGQKGADDDFESAQKPHYQSARNARRLYQQRRMKRALMGSCLALLICLAFTMLYVLQPAPQASLDMSSQGMTSEMADAANAKKVTLKIEVVDQLNEEGKTVTVVTIEKGLRLNPVLAGVLVGAATIYLAILVVQICIKKRRGIQHGYSSDEDEMFESVYDYTESSDVNDEFETSASKSLANSDCGRAKDTMSNSSIGELHPTFLFKNEGQPTQQNPKRAAHQRNVSKLIFAQSVSETDSQANADHLRGRPPKAPIQIETDLSDQGLQQYQNAYFSIQGSHVRVSSVSPQNQAWLAESLYEASRQAHGANQDQLKLKAHHPLFRKSGSNLHLNAQQPNLLFVSERDSSTNSQRELLV